MRCGSQQSTPLDTQPDSLWLPDKRRARQGWLQQSIHQKSAFRNSAGQPCIVPCLETWYTIVARLPKYARWLIEMEIPMSKSESDRTRWDRKYAAGEGPAHFRPKRFLVENRHLLSGQRALDVACGFGGNAMYLASTGFQVDALDVSGIALSRARAEAIRRSLCVNWVQADLDRWWFPADRYDLVTVFFYLNRDLMPHLASTL
jgi:2-polyprenyl-3-methyl-5-hydroxy-6-metoxy-1,4-benzoquinol methylase